jgi:hypothetical protein
MLFTPGGTTNRAPFCFSLSLTGNDAATPYERYYSDILNSAYILLLMNRVEYTLSFENYLEMTGPRSKKPRFKPALTSALVGFCGIVAGYGYFQIWPDTRTTIGASLLALGLVATFLAFLLGFFAKPKSAQPDTALLKREYFQSHADKRAIEFDEKGWRVFWYEGEDVRPWSCLRAIHELKTLLVLSTETTPYWLPKAALQEQGQLANIKALTEAALKKDEVLFAVPMRPGVFVYVVAQLFHYWRLQFQSRVLCYSPRYTFRLLDFGVGFRGDVTLGLAAVPRACPTVFLREPLLCSKLLFRERVRNGARGGDHARLHRLSGRYCALDCELSAFD